jgi:RNA polymerase sigma-70 factor (ECF subfamily)
MDEQQAITRLKQGDPNGLEVLVRLYQLQALRAASLITGDYPLAEDIVQNAFLRAAEKIDQFDSGRPFAPWFLRIVVNDAIKAAQKQKRQVSLDVDERDEPRNLPDPAPLPEELVETEEFHQSIQRALAKLPPVQRAAIVMRYYLGMSEQAMTEELDSPAGTVKWRLHEARRRLEELLRRSSDDRKRESGHE